MRYFLVLCLCVVYGVEAFSATYRVGPSQKLSSLGEVPWESLQPGDQVEIYWRPQPYREKFVICRSGTAEAPIIVRGVSGAGGERPVIDGENATTRKQLQYWGDVRGVIKIGGAVNPPDSMPRYIVLDNLDIRGGRPPFSFTAGNGEKKDYRKNAAAIYVEKADHLTIRNCTIHDSGNGLFVSSNNDQASTDILVEGCYIFDNGNPKSGYEHNVYTEAIGIAFQFNHFGPLRVGCIGNNLKDRSAGTVIRYNWIEAGNNVLDLVEGEDSVFVRKSPLYSKTMVYGNVIIKHEGLHNYIVHFGGDSGQASLLRKGTLYFCNNTIISQRKYNAAVFRLSSNDAKVDCRNNIFYGPGHDKPFVFMVDKGVVTFTHNWAQEGSQPFTTKNPGRGKFLDDKTSIYGHSPDFVNERTGDFHLSANSSCRDAGAKISSDILPEHEVLREYVKHRRSDSRGKDGKIDIGAFEFRKSQ